MLDENLPTFHFEKSSDNPLSTLLYFTHDGSEPAAEYALRRPDPALPAAKNKYAVGLCDAWNQDVIYGEVLIEPEFQQAALSAAEARQLGGAQPPAVPVIPEGFDIQLYNPDQTIKVRSEKTSWTGKESWEFDIPQVSFRQPSGSKLDQSQSKGPAADLAPKLMFRWKRDSKFSKDMTCFMCGRSVGGRRSKEPDITLAMFKTGKQTAVTIYEPNLMRVEIEDRKGLEVALLLCAEVIRDLYLTPSRDLFNVNGAAPVPNKGKNPKPPTPTAGPSMAPAGPQKHTMTGALNAPPAIAMPERPSAASPTANGQSKAEIEAETRRLQAMVEEEEREFERQRKETEKQTKRMLAEQEKERKRREIEIAQETEALRRQFGMQGQDFNFGARPNLPPRPSGGGLSPTFAQGPMPPMPPRPVSAGPPPTQGSWWHGPGVAPQPPQPVPYQQGRPPQQGNGRRRGGSAGENKIQKKKSTFF